MSATTSRAVRVLAVVLAQLVLVGLAVWPQLSARVTGSQVVLRVEPVDPIDPFRGAYVALSYPDLPDSAVGPSQGEPEQEAVGRARGEAYVPLTRRGDVWVGGPVQRTPPTDGPYLSCDDSSWQLRCGIETWFLPQDEAAGMQDALRGGSAVATVTVDAAGHAALLGVTTR